MNLFKRLLPRRTRTVYHRCPVGHEWSDEKTLPVCPVCAPPPEHEVAIRIHVDREVEHLTIRFAGRIRPRLGPKFVASLASEILRELQNPEER